MVSSSGTLMSSLESSLTISAVGSSRNSWFWMTSRKCSWRMDEGTGSRCLSAKGPRQGRRGDKKSALVERNDAETLFQLFQWQCHLFSLSQVNKTSTHQATNQSGSSNKKRGAFSQAYKSQKLLIITAALSNNKIFLMRNRKAIQTNISKTLVEHSHLISFGNQKIAKLGDITALAASSRTIFKFSHRVHR